MTIIQKHLPMPTTCFWSGKMTHVSSCAWQGTMVSPSPQTRSNQMTNRTQIPGTTNRGIMIQPMPTRPSVMAAAVVAQDGLVEKGVVVVTAITSNASVVGQWGIMPLSALKLSRTHSICWLKRPRQEPTCSIMQH